MIVVMIISIVSVRLVLRELGVIDYGLYNAIGGVVTAMSFVTSVMASASQRFFSVELATGNIEEQKQTCCSVIISFVIIMFVGAFLIESVGLWFLVEKMNIPSARYDACLWVFHLSTLTLMIHLFATPFHSLVVAHEEMNVYAVVSIFDALLKIGCVLLLAVGHFDKLILYSVLLAVEAFLIWGIYFIVAIRKYPELRFTLNFDFQRVKKILSFSSWTLIGSLAGTATNQGTNILLNIFAGPVANAAYAISNQIGIAINTCGFGFFSAVRPPLMKTYVLGKNDRTLQMFNLSNKLLFILLMFAIVPLYVCAPEIFKIWIGGENIYAVAFMRIMILCVFIQCLSNPITTLIQAGGNVRNYHIVVDGFILCSIFLSYLLMRVRLEVHWILMVNLFFFAIGHLIRLHFLQKETSLKVKPYIISFLTPAMCITITAMLLFNLVCSFISNAPIMKVVLITILNVLYVIISSYLLLLVKEEKEYIIKFVKSKIK